MAVRLPQRKLCGTAEAAEVYGCTVAHIRWMAAHGEIWSQKISERSFVYDAEELARLASDKDKLRRSGKLGGRRPKGRQSA